MPYDPTAPVLRPGTASDRITITPAAPGTGRGRQEMGESMLESLGLDMDALAVYRAMFEYPQAEVKQLTERLGWPEERVRTAMDALARLSLLRPSSDVRGAARAVNPEVAFAAMIEAREAEIFERQRELQASRNAVARMVQDYGELRSSQRSGGTEQLIGLDEVRAKIESLTRSARHELVSLVPSGSISAEGIKASRPVNRELLGRGVRMRTVYLASMQNNTATSAHIRWLADLGCEVRTRPALPIRMMIVDRELALVPLDPEEVNSGAMLLRGSGATAALYALFEYIWDIATPWGERPEKSDDGLTGQEREVLRLLGEGHTDEVVARKLGVSVRTCRRITAELSTRLGAVSRFQAGLRAAQEGWLTSRS
ncbi:hypothetical protein Slala02_38480 [Streptomyces lavendulae subsp. lavendulae]|nr:hypothetical protein Slala01_44540 [Streptomyces lavendulae subsp. lavendulae]GLX28028.1 hypothetical protein Slala02_38480 [Streptomyces lavendulae subsp. lavendulae]